MTEYRTILADPPWPERGGGKCKRGADRHYDLLDCGDIGRVFRMCEMFRPAADAHLWLWTTNNYLPQALALMAHLGFRYVNNVVWVKMSDAALTSFPPADTFRPILMAADMLQIGLGQYQRGAHELLLFGTRGRASVPGPKDRLPSVVFAPRNQHSRKPEVFRERIARVSCPPRLEMFARRRARGWDSWGNEVPA